MDVLTDLLERARARGGVFAASTLHAPWGIELDGGQPLAVHVVLAGTVWLEVVDAPPHRLDAGDVVLVASSVPHRLVHAPAAEALSLAQMQSFRVPGTESVYVVDGHGSPTSLVCGAYRFHGDICSSLLEALPSVVHLSGPRAERLAPYVRLIADEIEGASPGRNTVLDRLLDVFLVQILRVWFADGAEAPGWCRALDHPQVGRALRLLHEDPARRWRVDTLADEVGLSRAAFARQFTARVGVSPLRYLTDWRMGLAAERLRDSDDPIGRIAHAVGYDNEFAFSVAFRRHHGQPPSVFRSQLRASA